MDSANHFSSEPDCNSKNRSSILLVCVPLSQQYHLSRIDGALMYNDSRVILHKLCQIPKNCQKNDFRSPRTSASSFVFPEKFSIYMGVILSIV